MKRNRGYIRAVIKSMFRDIFRVCDGNTCQFTWNVVIIILSVCIILIGKTRCCMIAVFCDCAEQVAENRLR